MRRQQLQASLSLLHSAPSPHSVWRLVTSPSVYRPSHVHLGIIKLCQLTEWMLDQKERRERQNIFIPVGSSVPRTSWNRDTPKQFATKCVQCLASSAYLHMWMAAMGLEIMRAQRIVKCTQKEPWWNKPKAHLCGPPRGAHMTTRDLYLVPSFAPRIQKQPTSKARGVCSPERFWIVLLSKRGERDRICQALPLEHLIELDQFGTNQVWPMKSTDQQFPNIPPGSVPAASSAGNCPLWNTQGLRRCDPKLMRFHEILPDDI